MTFRMPPPHSLRQSASHRTNRWFIIIVSVLLLAAPAAMAELAQDRFFVRAGAFHADIDSKVRLDVPRLGISGALLDMENDIGLRQEAWALFGTIGYRFNPAWRVEFAYLQIDRSGGRSVTRTLQVEDLQFEVGARIDGSFVSNLYNLDLHWTPISAPTYDLGFSLGFHITDFQLGLRGEAKLGNSLAFRSVTKEQLAPLPTLGTSGRILIAKNLTLTGAVEIFALDSDGYKGRLVDAEAGLLWQATPNMGIGASVRTLQYKLKVTRERWTGRINYDLTGPTLFATFGF